MKTKLSTKGFSNDSVVPVSENKPHIVFRQGYWRVSQYKPKVVGFEKYNLFAKAHSFVDKLNNELRYPWGYENV